MAPSFFAWVNSGDQNRAAVMLRCVKIAKRKAGQPGKQARRELARIGRSDAFATLLQWVQHTASSMDAKVSFV